MSKYLFNIQFRRALRDRDWQKVEKAFLTYGEHLERLDAPHAQQNRGNHG